MSIVVLPIHIYQQPDQMVFSVVNMADARVAHRFAKLVIRYRMAKERTPYICCYLSISESEMKALRDREEVIKHFSYIGIPGAKINILKTVTDALIQNQPEFYCGIDDEINKITVDEDNEPRMQAYVESFVHETLKILAEVS